MIEAPQNPFGMVHTTLWEMLLRHPSFVADVKERNRIRFDSKTDRDPIKSQIQAGDLPEVCIVADTLTANLHSTSNTSMITRQYAVMIATGDYRYSEFLARVEWEVFVALLDWRKRLTALKWNDKGFVKRANLLSGGAGLSDPKLNRNIVGWSATWRVEVEMHFATIDLTAELEQSAAA